MKKIFLLFALLVIPCVIQAEEDNSQEKSMVVAFNFNNFNLTFSPTPRKKTIAEDPPYYLLFENGDRILTENGDLLQKEWK